MNAILSALIFAAGWSSAPVSAPYGFVETGSVAIASDGSILELGEVAPYAPYSLTCQHSTQTVVVPAAGGGTRQIMVNRC